MSSSESSPQLYFAQKRSKFSSSTDLLERPSISFRSNEEQMQIVDSFAGRDPAHHFARKQSRCSLLHFCWNRPSTLFYSRKVHSVQSPGLTAMRAPGTASVTVKSRINSRGHLAAAAYSAAASSFIGFLREEKQVMFILMQLRFF